jgi:lipoprotein-anchoring transpeptidase ErfK/SrfK
MGWECIETWATRQGKYVDQVTRSQSLVFSIRMHWNHRGAGAGARSIQSIPESGTPSDALARFNRRSFRPIDAHRKDSYRSVRIRRQFPAVRGHWNRAWPRLSASKSSAIAGQMRPCLAALGIIAVLGGSLPTWAADKTAVPTKADLVVIVKSTRTLTLLNHGQVLKTYKVALGGDPVGPKVKAGDKRTPEGEYTIDSKNPHSRFHLALHISYPNAADRDRAHKLGVSPGGGVEIHGLESKYAWVGSLHRQVNWTAGCIAVTNPEIEEIYKLVPVGTPVEIRAEEKPTEHTETASKPKQ